MSDIDSIVRELAGQLAGPSDGPLGLFQGIVSSIDDATHCSLILHADAEPVAGWRWLWDGVIPVPGDLVWVLDGGGPGSRFIIGMTNGPSYRARGAAPIYAKLDAELPPALRTSWPSFLSFNPDYGVTDLSAGGATPGRLMYYVLLHAGTYKYTSRFVTGPNVGRSEILIDDVNPSGFAFEGYAAAYAPIVYEWPSNFVVPYNKYVKVEIVKTGTKHASASDYYVLWSALGIGQVGP